MTDNTLQLTGDRLEFFAPCPRGAEKFLADELRALKCRSVRPVAAGVSFGGRLEHAYRALMWSRTASRVLLTLARVSAASADELYAAVNALPWEDHVRADGTIAVDATGVNAALRNTQFTAVRVKDAIADRFTARGGVRPSVDTVRPDLLVNVVIRGDRATISIDLAGEPLHRRGYREPGVQVAAPMKETLAAAVLLVAGWPEIAEAGGAFVDPMCGSGTLAIEAAMMAGDIAPGLLRERWGFSAWLGHDAGDWERVRTAAVMRREAGLAAMAPVLGYDVDPRAIEVATACVVRAGLEGRVSVGRRLVAELVAPEGDAAGGGAERSGLVATNPPYGERIGERRELATLYAELASGLREGGFAGWRLAVITPDAGLAAGLQMTPEWTVGLYNGRIATNVSVFRVARVAGSSAAVVETRAPQPPAEGVGQLDSQLEAQLDPQAEAFANRLAKMSRHYAKWARKAGVSCYRVYDADLPDYSVAIDVYTGAGSDSGTVWVHVAEYAPPPGIDPDRAERRLDDILAIVPGVLGVEAEDVFLKVRKRQRGSEQYERVARKGVVGTVAEGGLLFEVNLSDYLDTGIFLDHRLTRAWLRELAEGKRFLNLFAYTGSATAYAADGGAASTMTVDMSSTYLEWSARNMAKNGFTGPEHIRVRTDVLEWIAAAGRGTERFDLIFCDPPTFSNSKRMADTWDVQRDHAGLIVACAAMLSEGGLLVFSCNRRRFVLDDDALSAAGLVAEDMTARTVARDFERRPDMHRCWAIRRAAGAQA